MTELERFQELLDTHGAQHGAWPPADRVWAEGLLARSAAARDLHERASALDAMIAGAMAGTAGAGLRSRIMAIPAGHARPVTTRRGWGMAFGLPWRIGAAAVTASVLCGAVAGATDLLPFEGLEQGGGDVVDIAELAFAPVIDEETLP